MEEHNTHAKGEIAELKVALRAKEKGLTLSKPLSASCRYDFVIDDGITLTKAQVKYANGSSSASQGVVVVGLRKCHKNKTLLYSKNEIDVLLVYIPELDKIISVPVEQIEGMKALYLRLEKPLKNMALAKNKRYWFVHDLIW